MAVDYLVYKRPKSPMYVYKVRGTDRDEAFAAVFHKHRTTKPEEFVVCDHVDVYPVDEFDQPDIDLTTAVGREWLAQEPYF
jgi:hypothetical protein